MPSQPFFLFAPGAGAPSTSRWMVAWRKRLETLGDVVAFDYPYMRAGRKSPDRPPVLIAAHREALASAVAGLAPGRPVFLAGKSMGGRMGCHLAVEQAAAPPTLPRTSVVAISGLICLGYPLQSGATGAMRDEVLVALRTPILFVQGTRDPLCPLDALEDVRRRMRAPTALHRVEGGNHSLTVGRRALQAAGETQDDVDARTLAAIAAFLG